MGFQMKNDTIDSTIIEKKSDTIFKKPSMYYVIYLNDDYTTMEFVTWTLIKFFNKTEEEAEIITQKIHEEGKGTAGLYSKEIAETKMYDVQNIARLNEYPLALIMEKSE